MSVDEPLTCRISVDGRLADEKTDVGTRGSSDNQPDARRQLRSVDYPATGRSVGPSISDLRSKLRTPRPQRGPALRGARHPAHPAPPGPGDLKCLSTRHRRLRPPRPSPRQDHAGGDHRFAASRGARGTSLEEPAQLSATPCGAAALTCQDVSGPLVQCPSEGFLQCLRQSQR